MSGKTESVVEEIVSKFRSSVEAALSRPGREFDDLELRARDIGQLAARMSMQALVDRLGTGHVGPTYRGRDQVQRVFNRYGEREVQTLAGPVTLRRAYYLDPTGKASGAFPLDEEFGLGPERQSPKLEQAICHLGAWVPFERAPALIEGLLGWAVSEQTVRRTTERLGERAAEKSRRDAAAFKEAPKSFAPERETERLAIALDGTMAHMGGEWREAKVGAVFAFDESGEQVPGSKRYVARFGDPGEIGNVLALESHRSGLSRSKQLVVLGDGAPWIWNLFDEHFPDAVGILDFFHAMEHVTAVATARFSSNALARAAWIERAKERLKGDDVDWLIAEVELAAKAAGSPPQGAADDDPRLVLARNLQYFRTNRDRMLYCTFRACGLPIGSGVIEAACKSVVQQRMKGPGMRWGTRGGPAILAARVAVLNGDLPRSIARPPLSPLARVA